MYNILVTGSNGQLGSEIRELSEHFLQYNFIFTDLKELDLADSNAVEFFFEGNEIDVCINCAAYTAVDNAEDDRELAMLVNCTAVENLARVCAKNSSLLIHVSTDYVFNGHHFKPYEETDTPSPDSFYGLTKLNGEEAIFRVSNRAIIIRTSWLYSTYGNNFVSTMIRLGKERDNLGVVADQVGTPTYAADLAAAIIEIIQKYDNGEVKQIYHYSNEGAISWYDFAKAIMNECDIECNVNAIESKDFPAKAPRPFYSVLSKSKIKNDYKIDVPYWFDSLKVMINKLS